ncbi:MAG: hypothetical protein PHX43_00285 [Alphaproteobacteria bacterium]|nr:hypothetical protein [Alphaproteobacteria bacterium]
MENKVIKMDASEVVDRRVPLALIFAVLLQAATVVWWASAKERDVFFINQRVSELEINLSRTSGAYGQVAERLARIEERMSAQMSSLERIEKQLKPNRQ